MADFVGPALPPDMQADPVVESVEPAPPSESSSRGRTVGPTMPTAEEFELLQRRHTTLIGPAVPTGDEEDREDEMAAARAAQARDVKKKPKREEWMTKVPTGPSGNLPVWKAIHRKDRFSAHDVEKGDSSGWTETPVDRERRAQEAQARHETGKESKRTKETREMTQEERDTALLFAEFNRARGESLVDKHTRTVKKARTEQPPEYRPFDRERDLKTSRMDPKAAQKLLQDAPRGLANRFTSTGYK